MDDIVIKAQEFEKHNDWKKALELYKSAKTNDIRIIEKIGWCNSRLGNYNEAIIAFLECLKGDNSAKYFYMIGYQYYCLKEWNKAIDYYEKSLVLFPEYLIARYRLSYAYFQLAGDYKQFTKPEFWRCVGNLEECHNIWKKSKIEFRNKNLSTYADICFLHGKILINLDGKLENAIQLLEKACSIKSDENYRYELSKAYYKLGNIEKSEETLPISNKYYIQELKAYILIEKRKYSEALKIVKKISNRRKKEYIEQIEAYINYLSGDYKESYRLLSKIIGKNNNNHKAHFLLACVYKENYFLIHAIKEAEEANKIKISLYGSTYKEAVVLVNELNTMISNEYKEDDCAFANLVCNCKTQIGKIHKYDSDRGYGFIMSNNRRIFFKKADCLFNEIEVNKGVEFQIIRTKKGLKAINIEYK